MFDNATQKLVFETISAALPFDLDASKIGVEPGVAYVKSPIKAHDYAVGVMAAFGSVVEHLGTIRGLRYGSPRRLSGNRTMNSVLPGSLRKAMSP